MLGPVLVLAALTGAPTYAALSREATEVSNLGRLLEGYLEDCKADVPGFDAAACQRRVKLARKEVDGQILRLDVDVEGRLSFAGWDARKKAYRLHLVPIFDERGLGLSVGQPKRLDKMGRPVLRNVPIWVPKAEGEPEHIFKRRLARGMVRLEVLVEPQRAWRLRRKGDEDLRGMAVKLVGLRLFPARGDKVLAEQTY